MKYGNGKFAQHSYGISPNIETYGNIANTTEQYIFVRKYRDIAVKSDRAYLSALRLNILQDNILAAIEKISTKTGETLEFAKKTYKDGDLSPNETEWNIIFDTVKKMWELSNVDDISVKLVSTKRPTYDDINDIEKALYLIIRSD